MLDNASKFSPAGATIHLSVGGNDRVATINVRDEGIGIDASDPACVFEPFARFARPLHGGPAGLGVGLTLAKGLLERVDGLIEARSEGQGHGSEFRILLPRMEPVP